MIVFPNAKSISPLLQTTFNLSMKHVGRGFDVLCFRKDEVLLLTWQNGEVWYASHRLLTNTTIGVQDCDNSETMLSALSSLSKGEKIIVTGREGLISGDESDPFFENVKLYAPGSRMIPIFQAIQNERVDGDKVQQSFAILYAKEIPFKIIRIYLNGGLKVQRKTEASPADSFEDLVTYLFSA